MSGADQRWNAPRAYALTRTMAKRALPRLLRDRASLVLAFRDRKTGRLDHLSDDEWEQVKQSIESRIEEIDREIREISDAGGSEGNNAKAT